MILVDRISASAAAEPTPMQLEDVADGDTDELAAPQE